MMKKILLIITGAFNLGGGIANVNKLIIKTLTDFYGKSAKYDIMALCEFSDQIDIRYSNNNEISYTIYRNNKIRFLLELYRKILLEKYHFIFCDTIGIASGLAPFSAIKRCKYTVWVHGVEIFPPNPTYRGKLGLKFAERCLTSSIFTHQIIKKNFSSIQNYPCELAIDPFRFNNQVSHHDSLDSDIILKAVNNNFYPLGEKVILMVGRMAFTERYKGHRELINSLPKICREFPDVQMVMVGDGDDRNNLISLVDKFPDNIKASIFLPGKVSDNLLNKLYLKSYIFAMPSRGEGFGLVYLEAMSWGKACLGSRVDAASTVIRHEETGILIDDPKSSDEIADKLILLLSDPEKTLRMGKNAKELLNRYYTYYNFSKRFMKISGIK